MNKVEELKTNNKILIVEPYRGAKVHHKMRCMVCNHIWEATPISKSQTFKKYGVGGCPSCFEREKQKRFKDQRNVNIQKLEQRFDIISKYDGRFVLDKSNLPVMVIVRNKQCGHTFTASAKNLIAKNTECGVCGPQKRILKATAWSKANSAEWQKTADIWDQYRHKVYMATRRTYHKYKDTINPNNLRRGKAGQKGAYHLDHIVPVRWCFEHYVPIEICADHTNLQMLHWNTNVGSRDRLKEGVEIPQIIREYIPE